MMKKFIAGLLTTALLVTGFNLPTAKADSITYTELTPNQPITAELSTKDEVDGYKFTFTEDGILTINFKMETVGEDCGWGWDIKLFDEKGDIASAGGVTTSHTFGQLPFKKGEVIYIKVDNSHSNMWTKGVKYVITPGYTTNPLWEAEGNDTVAEAKTIDTNTEYHGTMYLKSDVDYYKLPITNNGLYQLTFKPAEVDPDCGWGWNITILNANNEVIDKATEVKNSIQFGQLGFAADNVLYIRIENTHSGVSAVNAEYIINVKTEDSTGWEKEYNNDRSSAEALSLNTTHYGTLMTKDDEDYYKVDIKEAGTVGISLASALSNNQDDIGWGWNVIIMDKEGNTLENGELIEVKTKNTMSVGVKAGTYYIKICARHSGVAPINLKYELSTDFVKSVKNKEIKVPTIKNRSVTIKWKKLKGINGYEIRYATKKTMDKAKVKKVAASKTSYTIKNLKAKKTYYIQIRAYKKVATGETVYGNWSSKKKVKTK